MDLYFTSIRNGYFCKNELVKKKKERMKQRLQLNLSMLMRFLEIENDSVQLW